MNKFITSIFIVFLIVSCGKKDAEKLTLDKEVSLFSPWYALNDKLQMDLHEDHSLIISDAYKKLNKSKTKIRGNWRVNEETREVFVTINDKTDTYVYTNPNEDIAAILVKNRLDNANLNESWFSVLPDENSEEPQLTP